MKFTLTSMSYDFGNGTVHVQLNGRTDDGKLTFFSGIVPVKAPSDVSSDKLQEFLIEHVRTAFAHLQKFEIKTSN